MFTDHSTKVRLEAFRNNKAIHQFIANISDGDKSEDDDKQLADASEDVSTHLVEVKFNNDDDNDDTNDLLFFHLVNINDSDPCTAFTAALQDATATRLLADATPSSRYAGHFYGVMVDSGCAREGRTRYGKYIGILKGK